MLNRLRFQELDRAVFKVRTAGCYGGTRYEKGEPFLVIDDAVMSNFSINQRTNTFTGRSTEANTSTIESVTFELTNGQIMLGVFGDIFGKQQENTEAFYTLTGSEVLNGTNVLTLPSQPYGTLTLYYMDEYGKLTKIPREDYAIDGQEITFGDEMNKTVSYAYSEKFEAKEITNIRQLGQELVLSLELQCEALDVITEEKFGVLLNFPKVVLGTDFSITFNNSESASGSILYVMAVPEDLQNGVNKGVFTIEVM